MPTIREHGRVLNGVGGVLSDKSADYEEVAEPLRNFAPALESLLRELLVSQEIQFHYIRSRVKTKVSTARKLANPAKSYTGIADLTDMLGVRIVTYFPDDVDRVAKVIRDEFAIDEENSTDKRALLDSDRFGYLSLHYIARLGGGRSQLAEYARFSKVTFEIQIRSILQHAWAEIEHDLGYKSSNAIPVQIRRRFSRVAGLLEVADNEFQEIRKYLDRHQRRLEVAGSRQWKGVALDQDSVHVFIRREAVSRALDRRIAKSLKMSLAHSDRNYAEVRQEELVNAGFDNLLDVKKEIERDSELIAKFSHSWISNEKTGPLWPKGSSLAGAEWQFDEGEEDSDDEFDVLPSGVGLFYLWLYKCGKGEVASPPYHEKTIGELQMTYKAIVAV